jgi:hypothetical protein
LHEIEEAVLGIDDDGPRRVGRFERNGALAVFIGNVVVVGLEDGERLGGGGRGEGQCQDTNKELPPSNVHLPSSPVVMLT